MVLPIAIAVITELSRQKMALSSRKSFAHVMVHAETDFTILSSPEGAELKELDSVKDIPNSSAMNISDIRKKTTAMDIHIDFNFDSISPRQQEIAKALVLCVAYASTIGGTFFNATFSQFPMFSTDVMRHHLYFILLGYCPDDPFS